MIDGGGQRTANWQVIDTLPVPIWRNTRSNRSVFRGFEADYGYCATKREYYDGFKLELRVSPLGMIVHYPLLQARSYDVRFLEDLVGEFRNDLRAPPKIPSWFGTRESEIINAITVSTKDILRSTMKKMKNYQPGFFDLETRSNKLTEMGDPLVALKQQIDWEAFRIDLSKVPEQHRKSNAGAKPIDVVLRFQMLVLQHL